MKVLVGFQNTGESNFIVDNIDASLRYVQCNNTLSILVPSIGYQTLSFHTGIHRIFRTLSKM